MDGVIQSVDEGQFVKYFLSFGVCQFVKGLQFAITWTEEYLN